MCLSYLASYFGCKRGKKVPLDRSVPFDRTVPNDSFHPGCYKCAYCGVKAWQTKCLRKYPQSKWRFIFYCDAHSTNAERDIVSILKELGFHRQSDVLKQPVFEILPVDLVKKSPWGSVGIGWFLNTSLWGDNINFVHRQADGTWIIAIDNSTPNSETYMPVEDLKMSLAEEDYGLVDDLIAWLSKSATV